MLGDGTRKGLFSISSRHLILFFKSSCFVLILVQLFFFFFYYISQLVRAVRSVNFAGRISLNGPLNLKVVPFPPA